MSLQREAAGVPVRTVAIVLSCVLALGVSLMWAFLSMRAVMEVGGACADGGPYVSAQPCPDGAVLIAAAIPLMLIAAMLGSALAVGAGAPDLLIPMWGVLFGSLGWNFWEYGLTADGAPVWGWIVCGVLFVLMALPALYAIVRGAGLTFLPGRGAAAAGAAPRRTWYTAYLLVGAVGGTLGWLTFQALA